MRARSSRQPRGAPPAVVEPTPNAVAKTMDAYGPGLIALGALLFLLVFGRKIFAGKPSKPSKKAAPAARSVNEPTERSKPVAEPEPSASTTTRSPVPPPPAPPPKTASKSSLLGEIGYRITNIHVHKSPITVCKDMSAYQNRVAKRTNAGISYIRGKGGTRSVTTFSLAKQVCGRMRL